MSSLDDLIQLLESFEAYLGNPEEPKTPVNFKQILIHDEQEALDWKHLNYIRDWGFMNYIIPQNSGGALNALDEVYLLSKLIARRDITVAIALGLSFFGALPFWISGTVEQKKLLAGLIKKGSIAALALTEETHGSDLTSNEVIAQPVEDGWELSGQKWCINFATEGDLVSVLCRTHEKGGLLGFGLFFIDKSLINTGFTPIPKLPTHGVRGLDISGFVLDKLRLPKDALIGTAQRGLELTYKTFQISRTLCAGLSVGGADTALRLALSFSLDRQLYGKPAYEIPAVKQRLGELFTQLLIADCTSLCVLRACTVFPEKLSFWSAIIKFLIPRLCEDLVEQCGIILGARGFLRTTPWAVFQKIRRDIQVVGLFDGSTQVNLSLIAGNLLPQVRMRGTNALVDSEQLKRMFHLESPCPPFEGDNLSLFTHEEDDVFAGLMQLDCEPINHLIAAVRDEIKTLDQQISQLREQKVFDARSLPAFRLAEHYCWIYAACCCLQFWYHNHHSLSHELKDINWLNLALQFILNKLDSSRLIESDLQEKMADHLCAYYQQKKLFAVISTKIAE
ncbi:acyl-CoA dehydrogenase [Legionella bononiensis]|uniref:Acyl-CoA dehydrogenase n=1 Tax=Legionella bononiensis TaxID=2793102 RepID=A0ABS1W704_9GAMM|nr:acyl-CoA dehydrogenase [Legionella bononiensis]MBL7481240.1 acyl-CoA dehydrogenase [Legionella bononiensis]MBL7525146.1 acyl-CoA dehydrogenase [Legionella bononiensis]MBL7562870.1 acyl-CoA dehydrogenase [Legionella bononiensis]